MVRPAAAATVVVALVAGAAEGAGRPERVERRCLRGSSSCGAPNLAAVGRRCVRRPGARAGLFAKRS